MLFSYAFTIPDPGAIPRARDNAVPHIHESSLLGS